METDRDTVAAAMEEASANARVVAHAVEVISVNMTRMHEDATASRATADAAMEHASAAADTTRQLEAASLRIDEVTALIRTIATRTQILALNATIEAARAGETGRGFAVVAREIKTLAQQTAEATVEVEAALSTIREGAHTARTHSDQVQTRLAATHTSMVAVVEAISTQTQGVQESATAMSQLFLGLQEISTKATAIAALCQDTTRDMTTVHHATDAVHAEGESIRTKAQELESLARRLRGILQSDHCDPEHPVTDMALPIASSHEGNNSPRALPPRGFNERQLPQPSTPTRLP